MQQMSDSSPQLLAEGDQKSQGHLSECSGSGRLVLLNRRCV